MTHYVTLSVTVYDAGIREISVGVPSEKKVRHCQIIKSRIKSY